MLENLKKYNIILASKSPRRRELLTGLGLSFTIAGAGDVDEHFPGGLDPAQAPEYVAALKASAYRPRMKENDLVITADTMVIIDGRIFGKPHDAREAREMLAALSGKTHSVVTGVCIATSGRETSFSVTTEVSFATLGEDEIEYYVEKFRPFDKAGAYGIQEWIGYVGCREICGSFYNVMGLPVSRLYEELKKI